MGQSIFESVTLRTQDFQGDFSNIQFFQDLPHFKQHRFYVKSILVTFCGFLEIKFSKIDTPSKSSFIYVQEVIPFKYFVIKQVYPFSFRNESQSHGKLREIVR